MATNLGKMVAYYEKLPSTVLHNPLNTWSLENTQEIKNIISTTTMPMATKPNRIVTFNE